MALATVISAIAGFMIYLHFAKKEHHGGLESRGLGLLFIRLLIPIVAMCAAMYLVTTYCLPIAGYSERIQSFIRLASASIVGGIVYLLALIVTNKTLAMSLISRFAKRLPIIRRFFK